MAESSNPTQIPPQQEQNPPTRTTTREPRGILREVGVATFRNAIGANCLSHSTEYADVPSLETIRAWFSTIGYSGDIGAKGTLKKSCFPLRVDIDYARLIWEDNINKLNKKTREKALKKNQVEGPPFTDHMLAICNAKEPMAFKAPKPPQKLRRRSPKAQSLELTSTIIHSESVSRYDALTVLTAEVDLGKSTPNDSISKQQDMDKGTQNYSLDHMFAETNLSVLVDKTKSARDRLKTVHTKTGTNFESKTENENKADDDVSFGDDEFNTSPDLSSSDDTKKEIKLEDLSKLTVKIQELNTQLLVLQTLNSKLIREKEAAKTEATCFKAQPSYPNVEQLTQLLVKSIKPELSKLLSSHDFSSSLPTELKDLPSKFNELTGHVKDLKKHVHDLEIELPGDLKEIHTKLETFTLTVKSLTTQVAELKTLQWELLIEFLYVLTQVASIQAKIKTLDALPSLLNKVTKALNKFAQVIESASKKARDLIVPSVGLAGTHPAEAEKNTQHPPKSSSQLEGELIKKDKDKESMSLKDVEEEGAESDFDDDTINLTGSMVESSKKKKMKKFDFVTKDGKHVHFTKEQIKDQKRNEESVKVDAAKQEVEARKEECIDLLGVDVVATAKGKMNDIASAHS
ncbi:hypothetical protein Tco_0546484 [Tanacetum coccineum]